MPEGVFGCTYVALSGVKHRPVAVVAILVMHHVLGGEVPFFVNCAVKSQLDDVGVGGVHKA